MRRMNTTRKEVGENRQSAGQLIAENQINNDINVKTLEDDIHSARKMWEKDILIAIEQTIARTLKDPKFFNKDFYISIHFRQHKMLNEPGYLMTARFSCPTPVYNHAVYKYKRTTGSVEFLWSIPNESKYYWYIKNITRIPRDMEMQAKFCYLMENGDLLNWVKKENGNKPDGVIKDAKNKPYVVNDEHKGEQTCLITQL